VVRDWRDERISELEVGLVTKDRRIASLEAERASKDARIAELEQQVSMLRRRSRYGDAVRALMAVMALFTGVYHLSRRRALELRSDIIGVRVSLGALSAVEARVGQLCNLR